MKIEKFERSVEVGEVINFEPGPSCQIKVEREDDDGNNTETMRQELDDISNLRALENTVNESTLSEPGPSHQIQTEREEDKNEIEAMRQELDYISNKRAVENTANESISNEPGPSIEGPGSFLSGYSQIKIEREDDGNETGTMRPASDDILNKRPLENTSTKCIKLDTSDNLITFKVYLLQHDAKKEQGSKIKPDEVHKFHLDKNIVNFTSLREKIVTICPVLQEKLFTLTWNDDEGDSIVISSDEALDIAIEEQSNVKKINIKLDNAEEDNIKADDCSDKAKLVVHKDVICDFCNEEDFQGLRYTCTVCRNFDLCSKCESKGLHLQHIMFRLPKSISCHSKMDKLLQKAKSATVKAFETQAEKKTGNSKKGLTQGRKTNIGKK